MSRNAKSSRAIQPKRRNSRVPRVDAAELTGALDVINGDGHLPQRYERARNDLTKVVSGLIRYCDRVEEALAGTERFTDAISGQEVTRELKTRDAKVMAACGLALDLMSVFDPLEWMKFEVHVLARRSDSSHETLSKKRGEFDEHGRVIKNKGKWIHRKPSSLPYQEDLFRLADPLIYPAGDVEKQLYWEFMQGIFSLDDLRRIRQCDGSGCNNFYLRKKVQKQPHYFCSDRCRKDFNNNKAMN